MYLSLVEKVIVSNFRIMNRGKWPLGGRLDLKNAVHPQFTFQGK